MVDPKRDGAGPRLLSGGNPQIPEQPGQKWVVATVVDQEARVQRQQIAALEDALAYAKTLSEAQVSKRQLEALEKKLAELKAK